MKYNAEAKLTIQERIEHYKRFREIYVKELENEKAKIIDYLTHTSDSVAFGRELETGLDTIKRELAQINEYDVLIREFENQAKAEETETTTNIEIYKDDYAELENWSKEHQVSIAEVVKEVIYLHHLHFLQDIDD